MARRAEDRVLQLPDLGKATVDSRPLERKRVSGSRRQPATSTSPMASRKEMATPASRSRRRLQLMSEVGILLNPPPPAHSLHI